MASKWPPNGLNVPPQHPGLNEVLRSCHTLAAPSNHTNNVATPSYQSTLIMWLHSCTSPLSSCSACRFPSNREAPQHSTADGASTPRSTPGGSMMGSRPQYHCLIARSQRPRISRQRHSRYDRRHIVRLRAMPMLTGPVYSTNRS